MRKRAPRPPSKVNPANAITNKRQATGTTEEISERRFRAFELRKAGASYRAITRQCGVSVETAWSDVQSELLALRQLTVKLAEDVRELELRRLDDWTLALTPKARTGDTKAIMTLVRVAERRARLLGIDSPIEVTETQLPSVQRIIHEFYPMVKESA